MSNTSTTAPTKPLRYAVVGGGAMGANHCRVVADLGGAELVAVVDADELRACGAARRYGAVPFTSVDAMLEAARPDAVIVAVPTVHHLEVGMAVIDRGINVLIEKPIAFTVEEGEKLNAAAEAAGVLLAVGHVERFNPAVQQLKKRVAEGELGRVFQLEARRQGPFPARVGDVGVVIDLAVHDLDVMRDVTGSEVTRLTAETQRRIHSEHEDLLVGVLRFANGAVGQLTINWLTPTKIRKLIVSGDRGMFEVNYLTQDLIYFENAQAADVPGWSTMHVLRGVSEGVMTRYVVNKREPLLMEHEAFLAACRDPQERGRVVSGRDGIAALQLATSLVHAGATGEVVTMGGPAT